MKKKMMTAAFLAALLLTACGSTGTVDSTTENGGTPADSQAAEQQTEDEPKAEESEEDILSQLDYMPFGSHSGFCLPTPTCLEKEPYSEYVRYSTKTVFSPDVLNGTIKYEPTSVISYTCSSGYASEGETPQLDSLLEDYFLEKIDDYLYEQYDTWSGHGGRPDFSQYKIESNTDIQILDQPAKHITGTISTVNDIDVHFVGNWYISSDFNQPEMIFLFTASDEQIDEMNRLEELIRTNIKPPEYLSEYIEHIKQEYDAKNGS